MTTLLDLSMSRTLDQISEHLLGERPAQPVKVWVFEDGTSRKYAQQRLSDEGLSVKFLAAYKPLIHFFLEEVDWADIAEVDIAYPVHPAAPDARFLIEAYPLAALAEDRPVRFAPSAATLDYTVRLTAANGTVTEHRVFAPNFVTTDHTGTEVLRCTGWIAQGDDVGTPLVTEFATIFDAAIDAVTNHAWGMVQPFFEQLTVKVTLPASDTPLPVFSEVISYREAMHEDLFFSLQECLGQKTGAMAGKAGASPGQIIPDILAGEAPSITITQHTFGPPVETDGATQALDTATRPLAMQQIREELASIGGEPFEFKSEAGRIVAGSYVAGSSPAILITSGQHANETSGPVGALRAAKALLNEPDAHFALVPVENVDGYQLHQHLIVENPLHMHHAARYSARGDDISAARAEPFPEQRARQKALALSNANLHLNLHGYPSHEWTRPLSGYLPRGFESWTVPKGFFLILCAQPGWEEIGTSLVEEVALGLSRNTGLVARNAAQIACFRAHVPDVPFEVKHGIPCFITANSFYDAPLTLITEATDETIYDAEFQEAHEAQTDTVLLAVAAYRRLIEDHALKSPIV